MVTAALAAQAAKQATIVDYGQQGHHLPPQRPCRSGKADPSTRMAPVRTLVCETDAGVSAVPRAPGLPAMESADHLYRQDPVADVERQGERLKVLNDKLAVKDVGALAGVASPRTLWAGTDPAELARASRSFTGR